MSGAGEHRRHVLGHWRAVRIQGRIHAVDHPVVRALGGAADREQAVAAVQALAVEDHLDLALLPLDRLERAAVPDPHDARAVLTLRDVALKLEVLERMVLGVDREPVLLRRLRQPVRDRPRDRDTIVLEPQIPVEPGRVVLLDDEAGRGRAAARALVGSVGLGGHGEVALCPVALERLTSVGGHQR